MDTIRIKSTDEASQGPFVVITRVDFNPEIHEALDPADLESLPTKLPLTVSSKVLDDARAEFQRMHADLMAERERLDAQSAELEAERARLAELAAKLAEQEEAKPLGIAALRDELTARGIEFDPAAKKADLQALLDAPK